VITYTLTVKCEGPDFGDGSHFEARGGLAGLLEAEANRLRRFGLQRGKVNVRDSRGVVVGHARTREEKS